MKRLLATLLTVMLLLSLSTAFAYEDPIQARMDILAQYPELEESDDAIPSWVEASDTIETAALDTLILDVPNACLIEKETGTVLFAQNDREQKPPASVTKVMTLLLIMEALQNDIIKLEDKVPVSAYAQNMGGSQVFMHEGETYTVKDMIKSIVIASGNDASVAMAEYLAGSEETFAARMNERAAELGMTDTVFKNCNGLPEDGHVTSARDIALMSRELLYHHPAIKEYTTIWMDTIRDGTFTLANTNKLVRFYPGATGLKTGSTSIAKFCLSGSAERDGMEVIAVVMGAETSDIRFNAARKMLDYGFANYALASAYPDQIPPPVPVTLGAMPEVVPEIAQSAKLLVEKRQLKGLTKTVALAESVEAPVAKGQKLGEVTISFEGAVLATIPIVAAQEIPRLTFWEIFSQLLRSFFMA